MVGFDDDPSFKEKHKNDGLNQKILPLYAKGMSISDIKIQLQELYGANISKNVPK
jgi:putative transposase